MVSQSATNILRLPRQEDDNFIRNHNYPVFCRDGTQQLASSENKKYFFTNKKGLLYIHKMAGITLQVNSLVSILGPIKSYNSVKYIFTTNIYN